MSERAAEFFVVFIVKLSAALVSRYRRTIKDETDLAAFEAKVEAAKHSGTRQEKSDAAGKITDAF